LEIGIKKVENKGGTYINLTISDTGDVIEEKDIERIFEPYFTTKKNQGGTGLGLAIVHSIVTQMKGFINVKSEIGKGTLFNIYLPLFEKD
ncbi:MAG: hypothetical protein HQK78_15355, partial [Desulfobacterales bacterium]|nr:hypothetical protein [Desulfobacterales bacterium]